MTDLAHTAITRAPVQQISDAVRDRDITVACLVEQCLRRAQDVRASLRPYVALDEQEARRQARDRDDELAHGRWRGPLHGIPFGIKDTIDISGQPTRAGSRVPDARPAQADAAVVVLLREAGAVVLGKTATHPLAAGVTTRATFNPWDPDRVAGGSSGGSAVAVAVGAAVAAVGTDTAGSVRIPAALCGVSALKPRNGILPLGGVVPLAPSLDTCGVLARRPSDLALLWNGLTGTAIRPPERALRIGVPAEPQDVEPAVQAAVDAAIARLAEAGAEVRRVQMPPARAWDRPRGRVVAAESLATYRALGWYPERVEYYDDEARETLRRAERLTEADIAEAWRELQPLVAQWRGLLTQCDVLAMPTVPVSAPRRSDDDDERHTATLTRLCAPANVADVAAASIPCGFDNDGLPVGLQILGMSEVEVLTAALLHERIGGCWRPPPEGR